MNSVTNTLNKKPFVPTEGMLEAARALFVAKARLALVTPIVLKYQTQILEAGQFRVREDFVEKGAAAGVVLDPSLAYLVSDADLAVFHQRCSEARDAAGLEVDDPGHCPMLVADHAVVKCEQDLILQMEEITKLTLEQVLLLQHEDYRQYVKLATGLLAPYVGTADDILSERRRLAFIICKAAEVAVHQYTATDEEAEIVDLAVANHAHLIRAAGPWGATKFLTFDALAQLVEQHYSMEDARVAETVSVLRRVHYRHAIQRSADRDSAEQARRAWVATLREGDKVEVPYSLAQEDIIQTRLVRKAGDGWLKLLPDGTANSCDNWITVCAVNGWTNPYAVAIKPPGATIARG